MLERQEIPLLDLTQNAPRIDHEYINNECHKIVFELFNRQADLTQHLEVLHSYRVVNEILYGAHTPSELNIRSLAKSVTELMRLRGFDLDENMILKSFSFWANIEVSLYPLAQMHACYTPYHNRKYDLIEMSSIGETLVERTLWHLWNLSAGGDCEQLTDNLIKHILGVLGRLEIITYRIASGDAFNVRSLSDAHEGTIMRNFLSGSLSDRSLSDMQELWYRLISTSKPSLNDIVSAINTLDDRLRLSLLILFGLAFPEKSKAEIEKKLNCPLYTLREDMIRGLIELKKTLGYGVASPQFSETLEDLIPNQNPYFKMGERVLNHDSPRIALYNYLRDRDVDDLTHMLSDIELQVLKLAVVVEEGGRTFSYTNEQIGIAINHEEGSIEGILTELNRITTEERGDEVLIDTNGNKIRNDSTQHQIIIFYREHSVENLTLSCMTDQQQTILELVLRTDKSGRYMPIEEVFRRTDSSDFSLLNKIITVLNEGEERILEAIDGFCLALDEYPAIFNKDEIRLMKKCVLRANQGLPLRSHNDTTIAYSSIASLLEIPEARAQSALRKIEHIRKCKKESKPVAYYPHLARINESSLLYRLISLSEEKIELARNHLTKIENEILDLIRTPLKPGIYRSYSQLTNQGLVPNAGINLKHILNTVETIA